MVAIAHIAADYGSFNRIRQLGAQKLEALDFKKGGGGLGLSSLYKFTPMPTTCDCDVFHSHL